MGMFDPVGKSAAVGARKENTHLKRERLYRSLRHEEPDRVPISDFFWGSFTRRWRSELGLPDDANPYEYYDLDWIVGQAELLSPAAGEAAPEEVADRHAVRFLVPQRSVQPLTLVQRVLLATACRGGLADRLEHAHGRLVQTCARPGQSW